MVPTMHGLKWPPKRGHLAHAHVSGKFKNDNDKKQ